MIGKIVAATLPMLGTKLSKKTNNDKIKIEYTTYAKTYNILRIMSGMAGLAFYG